MYYLKRKLGLLMEKKSSFSIILRYLRKHMKKDNEIGLTLADLSELSGLTDSYISQLERGKRIASRDSVSKIAKGLTASSLLPASVVERFLNGLLGRNPMNRNDLIAVASACGTTTDILQNLGGFTVAERYSINNMLSSKYIELDGKVLTDSERKLFKTFVDVLRLNRRNNNKHN